MDSIECCRYFTLKLNLYLLQELQSWKCGFIARKSIYIIKTIHNQTNRRMVHNRKLYLQIFATSIPINCTDIFSLSYLRRSYISWLNLLTDILHTYIPYIAFCDNKARHTLQFRKPISANVKCLVYRIGNHSSSLKCEFPSNFMSNYYTKGSSRNGIVCVVLFLFA